MGVGVGWGGEAKARRLRQLVAKDDPKHLEFDTDCMTHQYHLIVMVLLLSMDWVMKKLHIDGLFWSTFAKLMYCWRDHNAEVFDIWINKFPDAPVWLRRFLKKLPPRPLAQR